MNATTKRRPRYAMSPMYCHQMGTQMASCGWKREDVITHMQRNSDLGPETLTVKRILRAYDRQIARG